MAQAEKITIARLFTHPLRRKKASVHVLTARRGRVEAIEGMSTAATSAVGRLADALAGLDLDDAREKVV